MYKLPRPKHWFSWSELLEPLSTEDVIDGSYHRYMRQLITEDLSLRLQDSTQDMEQLLLLEALVMLTARDDTKAHKNYRTRLAVLKRKYRRQISRQRKQLLEQYK